MNGAIQIPLFPLHLVLFPAMVLPLHIFEPRYKRMIGQCLEQESEFAIVCGSDERFARVACAAVVTALLERLPEGKMNILTRGTRRLRILEHFNDDPAEGKPLILGIAEAFEDDDEEVDPSLFEKVSQLYREALRLVAGWKPIEPGQALSPEALSYRVAAQLGIHPEAKQEILEMRSVNDRLHRVRNLLEPSLPGIREVKRRISGNGHFG